MNINPALNLVVSVARARDTVYVHCTPIAHEVFRRYFMVIAKTFSAINSEGLGVLGGPRVAAMLLEDKAREMGLWDGPSGVEAGLLSEVRRLANVVVPGERGWSPVPLQEALDQKWLTEEDVSEVENILVYFTVASAMHRRNAREAMLDGAAGLWDAQVSSLNCTEYAASLPKLTAAGSSGETATRSSVPG